MKRINKTWTVTSCHNKGFSDAEFTFYTLEDALSWVFSNVSHETM